MPRDRNHSEHVAGTGSASRIWPRLERVTKEKVRCVPTIFALAGIVFRFGNTLQLI